MKALKELRYIRDYHPEVVYRPIIDEAIEELEALESRTCEGCKYLDKNTGKSFYYCEEIESLSIGADTADGFYCSYWRKRQ